MDAGTMNLIVSGLGAANTLSSSYNQSQAIKAKGSYEANEHAFNARIAELQGDDAIRRGEEDQQAIRLERRRMIGRQRASAASQGVDVNAGSALAAQEETAYYGELDAQTAKTNAYLEALGYKSQAIEQSGQAKMKKLAAKYGARNTLLTGGMSAARDVMVAGYQYKKGI